MRIMANTDQTLIKYLKCYNTVDKLTSRLTELCDVFLIGGALRDYLGTNNCLTPRDFDIVVDLENEKLEKELSSYSLTRNRFGGFKIEDFQTSIDIWSLESTWAYREKIIKCAHREYGLHLQDTVFLNIDAIVYNITRNIWYNHRYLNAIQTKTLDIVLQENPQIEVNIMRTFVFKKKYSYNISDRLCKLIYEYVINHNDYIYALLGAQQSHYNKDIISKEALVDELNLIVNRITTIME